MPRQPPRRGRKRAPEEVPSSATREVIAIIREGPRITKKRLVEESTIDPRASPFSFPDDDTLNALASEMDSFEPSNEKGGSEQPFPNITSRSVSVSAICACHVDGRSSPLRPESGRGSHTERSTFMRSSAMKPLCIHPVPDAYGLQCIVVSAVLTES